MNQTKYGDLCENAFLFNPHSSFAIFWKHFFKPQELSNEPDFRYGNLYENTFFKPQEVMNHINLE